MEAMPPGLFITFEGGEASGKSTQVKSLQSRLQRRSIPVTVVREPGGTQLGDWLRQLLKFSPVSLTPEAELLLFNASRAQLVSQVVRPALARGEVVLCDRFTDSTLAYQGYGRGIPLERVELVNMVATEGLKADLTVFLDLPPEEGLKRQTTAGERFESGGNQRGAKTSDRTESQKYLFPDLHQEEEPGKRPSDTRGPEMDDILSFHQRVRQGYLALARREPERWLVVGALQTRQQVASDIWQRVEPLLQKATIAARGS